MSDFRGRKTTKDQVRGVGQSTPSRYLGTTNPSEIRLGLWTTQRMEERSPPWRSSLCALAGEGTCTQPSTLHPHWRSTTLTASTSSQDFPYPLVLIQTRRPRF